MIALMHARGAFHERFTWDQTADGITWDTCERADWMLWLAADVSIDRKRVVWAAARVAHWALGHLDPSDRSWPIDVYTAVLVWSRMAGDARQDLHRQNAILEALGTRHPHGGDHEDEMPETPHGYACRAMFDLAYAAIEQRAVEYKMDIVEVVQDVRTAWLIAKSADVYRAPAPKEVTRKLELELAREVREAIPWAEIEERSR